MMRTDAVGDVLLAVLGSPGRLADLGPLEWDLLLRQARRNRLLPHLACRAEDLRLDAGFPEPVRRHFAGARALGVDQIRTIRWELNRIARALDGLEVPVMLLKGAAYVAAGLPMARGRLVGDVDIMVPGEALDRVEAALRRHGWEPMKLEPYDQRYYRSWMHELPPLKHRERCTIIDVHHAILPRTSRLHPDPDRLWQAARSVPATGFRTLAPIDMLLHCATHLFHDGEIAGALRDLVDLDGLLRHFDGERDFWAELVPRARELGLARPLFYGLRYTARLLGTPVPAGVVAEAEAFAPPAPVLALMDRLVPAALVPGHPDRADRRAAMAALFLYLRAHWLRMPPPLLAAHLGRKAMMRLSGKRPGPGEDAATAK